MQEIKKGAVSTEGKPEIVSMSLNKKSTPGGEVGRTPMSFGLKKGDGSGDLRPKMYRADEVLAKIGK